MVLTEPACLWPMPHGLVHDHHDHHALLHPRQYTAYRLHPDDGGIHIDGTLGEQAWEQVPSTAPFLDIVGPHHEPQPWFATHVKLRYDSEMLYVAASLQGPEIWANETHKNAVIFHDNDFEVFVDPDGSTHNYKEIEVNAYNATWNLWLDKPYRSSGHENSTRVDPTYGFDMEPHGFKSAVHVDGGRLNDPSMKLHYWTVELALPLQQLALHTHANASVVDNQVWRINFSRVQWQVQVVDGHYQKIPNVAESNWVWSPQYAINMHRPEWWGYLHFSSDRPPLDDNRHESKDVYWALQFGTFQFFYAQEEYKTRHGKYATSLDKELQQLFPVQEALKVIKIISLEVTPDGDAYEAKTATDGVDHVAYLRSDSFYCITAKENAPSHMVDIL